MPRAVRARPSLLLSQARAPEPLVGFGRAGESLGLRIERQGPPAQLAGDVGQVAGRHGTMTDLDVGDRTVP